MKKTHIIGLIAIAIAVGVLISSSADFGTYSNFTEALENPDEEHQVVGYLSVDKEVVYEPEKDPNRFSFYMKDEDGKEHHVICLKQKPQDFERSEQVVVTGKLEGESFVAHKILMKCPSKYQDEAIQSAEVM